MSANQAAEREMLGRSIDCWAEAERDLARLRLTPEQLEDLGQDLVGVIAQAMASPVKAEEHFRAARAVVAELKARRVLHVR